LARYISELGWINWIESNQSSIDTYRNAATEIKLLRHSTSNFRLMNIGEMWGPLVLPTAVHHCSPAASSTFSQVLDTANTATLGK